MHQTRSISHSVYTTAHPNKTIHQSVKKDSLIRAKLKHSQVKGEDYGSKLSFFDVTLQSIAILPAGLRLL